ncbi:MAG TPA: hypothetical protein VFC05_07045, partial [Nitrososphaeraceae archaeon]|nr:hypothetical protein [Nitrososphaeraceae archaeon]
KISLLLKNFPYVKNIISWYQRNLISNIFTMIDAMFEYFTTLLIQNEDVNLKDFIDVEIAELLIVLTSVLQYTIIINENILLEVI